jgi:hypothetical protein
MRRSLGRLLRRSRDWTPVFLCSIALLVTACSSPETSDEQADSARSAASEDMAQSAAYRPVEFAMPPGSKIDRDKTLVVGSNSQWFGTLTLTTDSSLDQASAYYARKLPTEGWEALSSLIADRVVLQFINRQLGRACVVTINAGSMWSSTRIEIVVAPLVGR